MQMTNLVSFFKIYKTILIDIYAYFKGTIIIKFL